MEEKKYPIGGFAPGNYTCKCCICKQEFQGDKRAVQCEPCAVKSVGGLPPLTEPILTDEDVKNCEATINHDRVIANQVAGMPWEEAIFQDGYSAGVEFEKKRAKPGAVWVNALKQLPSKPGEYHSQKHGKKFVMLFAEADRKMPKEYWEGVEWLDESGTAAAGREEPSVELFAFAKWMDESRNAVTPDMWAEKTVWKQSDAFQEWLKYYLGTTFKQQKANP